MGRKQSCPSLREIWEDALTEWSKLRAENNNANNNNGVKWSRQCLVCCLLAAHIASRRGRPLDRVVARMPLFKVFRCHHFLPVVFVFSLRVTVQSEAACSPRTPLLLLSVETEGEAWRPAAAHFIPSKTHSGPVPSPTSPTGLSFTLLCTGIYM